jgi:hypothetical protein
LRTMREKATCRISGRGSADLTHEAPSLLGYRARALRVAHSRRHLLVHLQVLVGFVPSIGPPRKLPHQDRLRPSAIFVEERLVLGVPPTTEPLLSLLVSRCRAPRTPADPTPHSASRPGNRVRAIFAVTGVLEHVATEFTAANSRIRARCRSRARGLDEVAIAQTSDVQRVCRAIFSVC